MLKEKLVACDHIIEWTLFVRAKMPLWNVPSISNTKEKKLHISGDISSSEDVNYENPWEMQLQQLSDSYSFKVYWGYLQDFASDLHQDFCRKTFSVTTD